ncbi:MAG: dephospho-CoA kinase [Bacteroidetes bacterium RBG_19FT_COMBO_42_7]|nr:MAG: dephospho-CoA kinase [Bacteroidetes bacterium RBG_13_42_15]OFY77330.1 MAG: dephospho-CoA kinase [Bacteroidetes bacterium RBG_19FT_COMBO_42_7]
MKITQNQSLKLGVTGGIGSGKTTVCKVFAVLGIPVFSADTEAKRIQDSDRDLQIKINSLAGKDLFASGKLDRTEMAKLIFRDSDLLAKVNSIVHPAVFEYFREWLKKQDSPYAVMEAAILFESGAYRMMDRIVTVVTPMEERIERLVKGNKLTREQVTERIKNQIDDESRIKQSDYVIFNSENDTIIPAILGIHMEMLTLYNKTR